MAGYDDTGKLRLPLTNPDYWVEIKDCLSRGELAEAEAALTNATMTVGGDAVMTPDVSLWRNLMVFHSLTAWNILEPDESPRPITLETVKKLKGPDFDLIQEKVTELNSAKSIQEQTKIPG